MTNHLYLVTKQFLPRFIKTVQFSIDTDTHIIIVDTVKTIDRIRRHQIIFLLTIIFVNLPCIPTGSIIETRYNIYILEQLESSTDRNIMLHSIFPIPH